MFVDCSIKNIFIIIAFESSKKTREFPNLRMYKTVIWNHLNREWKSKMIFNKSCLICRENGKDFFLFYVSTVLYRYYCYIFTNLSTYRTYIRILLILHMTVNIYIHRFLLSKDFFSKSKFNRAFLQHSFTVIESKIAIFSVYRHSMVLGYWRDLIKVFRLLTCYSRL